MAKKKKKNKHPAAQPAAKPTPPKPEPVTETPPDTTDKGERWMGALCYLNLLILIPACSSRRKAEFVRFHLNQGLAVLALSTLTGVVALLPGMDTVGATLTVLVELISLVGLICALRGRKVPIPGIRLFVRMLHPF